MWAGEGTVTWEVTTAATSRSSVPGTRNQVVPSSQVAAASWAVVALISPASAAVRAMVMYPSPPGKRSRSSIIRASR